MHLIFSEAGGEMGTRSQIYEAGIKANLGWLDRLAWFAILFFATAVGSKALDLATIDFLGLAIHPRLAIVALVVLTLCHAFVAVHLVNSVGRGRRNMVSEDRERFYLEQLASGGLLIRSTRDYRNSFERPRIRGTVQLRTDARDPAVWFHLSLAALAVIGCIPFEVTWTAALYTCLAVVLVYLNFSIGAAWLIALADFGRSNEESLYFVEDSEQIRLKAYAISGPIPHFLGSQVSTREYIGRLAIEFAIHILPLLFLLGFARLVVALAQLLVVPTLL